MVGNYQRRKARERIKTFRTRVSAKKNHEAPEKPREISLLEWIEAKADKTGDN